MNSLEKTMLPESFAVRFQRNCRTYFTGEDVVGFVDVALTTWTEVNHVTLLFRGETLACWQEEETFSGVCNTIRAHKCHWRENVIINGRQITSSS